MANDSRGAARRSTGAAGKPATPPLSAAYHRIHAEQLPERIEIAFIAAAGEREVLHYEKRRWPGADGAYGLRYGENPEQRAALYRLCDERIVFDEIPTATDALGQITASELIHSGKHPSKINITDLDCGLQLLRYNMAEPTAIIIKHNNPCAVATAPSIATACMRAHAADSISAFGGVLVLNRSIDRATAEYIAAHYFELIAAPEYEIGTIAILQRRKNLRIVRVRNMDALVEQRALHLFQLHSLSDLSLCLQDQYRSPVNAATLTPASSIHDNTEYRAQHTVETSHIADCLFGWHIAESLWSNAVCFVKEGCTVGIGCGAVDRVGAVQIAIDKAYRNYKQQAARQRFGIDYHQLTNPNRQKEIDAAAMLHNGGLAESILCSDAFFPFTDGVQLAIRERVAAIVEPGGSLNDWQVITACNAARVALLFTGARAFRH